MTPEAADDAHDEPDVEEHVRHDDRRRGAGEGQDLAEGQSHHDGGQDERHRDDREQGAPRGYLEPVERIRGGEREEKAEHSADCGLDRRVGHDAPGGRRHEGLPRLRAEPGDHDRRDRDDDQGTDDGKGRDRPNGSG